MGFASSIYRRLPLCLVALLPLANVFASEWQRVASPTASDLHGVFFLDAANGWIIAHESGEVLHTADGGKTWTVQAGVDRGALEWVVFNDSRHGWICGEKGRIYRTEDGGESWRQTGPGGRRFGCSSLFFAGVEGLALGVDLGSSRRLDDLRPVIYDLADDRGSWTKRELELPGVAFTDALAVLGERTLVAGGFGVVYRSEDGGGNWEMIPLAGEDDERAVRGLSFVGERGWAVGGDGLVARTDDGGRGWHVPPPVTRNLLRDVLFVDPRNGFIVGERGPERGLIYHTTDGGETWRDVEGDHPPLHRVLAVDDHLWIVGAKGAILRRPKPVPPPPPAPPELPEEVPPTSQKQAAD